MFKRNEMTPWIRVVQPYTGGGKGSYFVEKRISKKDEE
jgi:hypothetical protein